MNSGTKVFLVLLRLAIGWHFLFEGVAKLDSIATGPTTTNRPWSSEGYLREASGPFANFFRHQAGDPDEKALAWLDVLPVPPGEDPAKYPPYKRFPTALDKEWNRYFERFVQHFQHVYEPLTEKDLTPEERAGKSAKQIQELLAARNEEKRKDSERANERFLSEAEAKLKQCKDQTVNWLLQDKKAYKQPLPHAHTEVEVEKTTAQRVEEYRKKLQEVRDIQEKELPAFHEDVEKDRLRTAKAEVNRLRTELMAGLNEQTEEMKKALEQTAYQDLDQWPARLVVLSAVPQPGLPANLALAARLSHTPEPPDPPVKTMDWVISWGLTIIGACLLLGLLSRTAAVAGAAFLLLVYLSMPPFPGLPENIKAEGHYLFVNKNLIEMLALLTLATTRSGRWMGLDALVQFLNPFRWRRPKVVTTSVPEERFESQLNLTH